MKNRKAYPSQVADERLIRLYDEPDGEASPAQGGLYPIAGVFEHESAFVMLRLLSIIAKQNGLNINRPAEWDYAVYIAEQSTVWN